MSARATDLLSLPGEAPTAGEGAGMSCWEMGGGVRGRR